MTKYSDYVPLYTEAESPHMKVKCSSCHAFVAKGDREVHIMAHHRHAFDLGLIIQLNDIWWRKRGT